MPAKYKLLILCLIALTCAAARAQEVPGTVIFRQVPKEDVPSAAPPAQTPFRKPPAEEKKPQPQPKTEAKKPEEKAAEEEQPDEPVRRPPASQRRAVLPPPGEEKTEPDEPKPMPEGRKPVDLIEMSPVVFSLADIAVYPWQEKEEYFEDDPAKVIRLKARVQRGDEVIQPDQFSRIPFPEGQGLLTIFSQNQVAEIPLTKIYFQQDIIFLDEEGVITQLVYKTEPKSKKPVFSKAEARSVLQMNGGSIKKYGIKLGDKIAIPPR